MKTTCMEDCIHRGGQSLRCRVTGFEFRFGFRVVESMGHNPNPHLEDIDKGLPPCVCNVAQHHKRGLVRRLHLCAGRFTECFQDTETGLI